MSRDTTELNTSLNATFHSSINAIAEEDWNSLCGTDYPFLRHEFFSALENSGCTSKETGWQPYHLTLSLASDDKVIAVMPLFLKTHSYGEYVFDWAWADAYQRHGFDYYPKLLNAIPFTPATGKRWGINKQFNENSIITAFQQAITEEAQKKNLSSCHILFLTKEKNQQWCHPQWRQRTGYQYHWFNEGYSCFDDFLAKMTSRKRKNIIKERRKITDQNITLVTKTGDQISPEEWQQFYLFYQSTYYKRSGHQGYLSAAFFPALASGLAENLVMIQAYKTEKTDNNNNNGNSIENLVAAALCFKDSETLYGRYWGCLDNYDSLHFEACYYQGIEYAIKNGLTRFDPGAQGEHKIQRGFTPITTYSSHWIANDDFSQAIERFLVQENKEVQQYLKDAAENLPFKKEANIQ
ncbi:MAG: putative N-acyltransferase [Granulosicoccus sp.]|jgi:predicted N-acyltransferase